MLVAKCDRCGTTDPERRVQSYMFCQGIGYKPTNSDPLAQKFEAHTIQKEFCVRCHGRVQHFVLTLSPEEQTQIAMLACMELEPDSPWQPLPEIEAEKKIGDPGW